jgi:hypothetical protein
MMLELPDLKPYGKFDWFIEKVYVAYILDAIPKVVEQSTMRRR